MSRQDYEYSGNLLGIDLSKPAEELSKQKTDMLTAARAKDKPAGKSNSVHKPKRPERAPWADRIPNADADYIIPDEALYPDDDDDDVPNR